jgi:hypothetical protein
MPNKLSQRFDELAEQLKEVEASEKPTYHSITEKHYDEVDYALFYTWKVKATHLIETACGKESQHLKAFVDASEGFMSRRGALGRMSAVFAGAKEDYQGGYCATVRSLVEAEVFDSELEQASELLDKHHKVPAAVVAGTVLETAIRGLCERNNLPHGKSDKLETMNAALVKAGVYNLTVQKRVTALADIRNNAAHGKQDAFTDDDVKSMIGEVERFLAQHLT